MNIQNYLADIVNLTNNIIIPFILGIAFLIFVINVIRFFVLGGSNQDAQEKARSTATYSVAAFVFIVLFWGVVNLLASSFGLDNCTQPRGDYVSYNDIGPNLPDCQ